MMAAPAPAALPPLPHQQPHPLPHQPSQPLTPLAALLPLEGRALLRLRSLGWAALTAAAAGLGAAALALLTSGGEAGPLLDASLRSAGCGAFYGLLAFHLQRVDPDDTHLQAGLVGAVCGIRSLGAAPPLRTSLAPSLMMELVRAWLPLWLPLIGSALLLHGLQRLLATLPPALLPALRP